MHHPSYFPKTYVVWFSNQKNQSPYIKYYAWEARHLGLKEDEKRMWGDLSYYLRILPKVMINENKIISVNGRGTGMNLW
jgi:hypothetical protein